MHGGPPTDGSRSYTMKEWAMFGLFPVLKVLGVPPTQPLAKIGAEQQKSVTTDAKPLNMWGAAKRIKQKRGVKGFFDGTAASMTREGFKSSYKGPLQVFANDLATSAVSADTYGCFFLRGIIAGTTVGVADPSIAGPIERYKTFKLTQDVDTNLFKFFRENYQQQQHGNVFRNMGGFVQELYRGLSVTIAKQTAMNVAFFTTKAWADSVVAPYKHDHPAASMAFSSLASGAGAAVVGAPLAVVKTLIQQHTGKESKKLKMLPLLKRVAERAGWRGLFAGAPAQFGLITFGYGINGLFLNLFAAFREKEIVVPPSSEGPSVDELAQKLQTVSLNDEQEELDELTTRVDSMDISSDMIDDLSRTYLLSRKQASQGVVRTFSEDEMHTPQAEVSSKPKRKI